MATIYTLADLLSPESAEDALDVLLTDLANEGFPATAWDDFDPIVGLLRADARALSDLLQLISNVSKAGLVELSPGTDPGSPGDWLSLLARNYGLGRFGSTFARIRATVAMSPTASPYNLTPGGLTIEHVAGGARYRYSSSPEYASTILAGGSLVVEFVAELPGVAHNRALGQLVAPVQSIPGMSVTLTDAGNGTPQVIAGVNAERDESLRARMRGRWDTIGLQKTSLGLEFLARNTPSVATPITRVSIDATNPRGPNTVNVWVATDAGVPVPADVALVRTYVRDRASIGSDVEVYAAVPAILSIGVTVRAPSAIPADVQEALRLVLDELALSIPLGGTLYLSRLVDVLQDESAGVRNVDVSTLTVNGIPAVGDFVLAGPSSVAVPGTHTITVLG